MTRSQGLELAYQSSIQKMDSVISNEELRKLRLQLLLVEEDNNGLHEQLASSDDRIDAIEQERDELLQQLQLARETSVSRDAELRTQAREIATLRVRVSCSSDFALC